MDLLNGITTVYLAYLSSTLGLSNTVVGAVASGYILLASLLQPLFGYFADRFGPRWVVASGVFWISGFYSLAILIPGTPKLVFLLLAGIGSGAFHPAGTMQATMVGRARFIGRETTSTSYFFLLGQGGLFLGPVLGGITLDWLGSYGLLILAILILPAGLNALFQLRGNPGHLHPQTVEDSQSQTVFKIGVGLIIILAVMAAMRSAVQQNMVTFVPKYLSDLGLTPNVYGAITALFMGGSAFGNVIGGNLADRFGKRRVAVLTLLMAVVPLSFLPSVTWLPWLYLLIPISGLFLGASHSIIVVFAQRIIPGGMGLASGLILGFMFSSGALGTLLSGYLADVWGIPFVFGLSAVFALIAGGLALGLKSITP